MADRDVFFPDPARGKQYGRGRSSEAQHSHFAEGIACLLRARQRRSTLAQTLDTPRASWPSVSFCPGRSRPSAARSADAQRGQLARSGSAVHGSTQTRQDLLRSGGSGEHDGGADGAIVALARTPDDLLCSNGYLDPELRLGYFWKPFQNKEPVKERNPPLVQQSPLGALARQAPCSLAGCWFGRAAASRDVARQECVRLGPENGWLEGTF